MNAVQMRVRAARQQRRLQLPNLWLHPHLICWQATMASSAFLSILVLHSDCGTSLPLQFCKAIRVSIATVACPAAWCVSVAEQCCRPASFCGLSQYCKRSLNGHWILPPPAALSYAAMSTLYLLAVHLFLAGSTWVSIFGKTWSGVLLNSSAYLPACRQHVSEPFHSARARARGGGGGGGGFSRGSRIGLVKLFNSKHD